MSLPIIIILIFYLIVAFCFTIFTFFNLYHAWRFGINNFTNFFTIFLYIASLIILFIWSLSFINSADWSMGINLL